MRTKQRNNLAETARHERVAQNTDVYAVKARNYKGLRRGSPVFCRNNWHIHYAKNGGGQILVCVAGRGYYQEWGKPAQELRPGDVVNIPTGVKHWHGAAPDSWFSHLAVEVPGDETSNEWLEAVDNTVYFKATGKEV
jgi:quercetin dioxygenase-like cupin family protein